MSTKKSKSAKKTSKKTAAKTAVAKPKAATAEPAKPKKASGKQNPKRVSALDAAAQILAEVGKPMRAQNLIAAMGEQGLWSSPNGKTPHATLYAAMMREARDKGDAARFKKVDRGMFELHSVAKAV